MKALLTLSIATGLVALGAGFLALNAGIMSLHYGDCARQAFKERKRK